MKKSFRTLLLIIFILPMVLFFSGCYTKNSDAGLNTYPVMFYTGSGDGNSFHYETQIVKHGYTVTRPKDPKKTGYSFGGWYKDRELTISWKFDEDRIYEITTIWAKWVEVEY